MSIFFSSFPEEAQVSPKLARISDASTSRRPLCGNVKTCLNFIQNFF